MTDLPDPISRRDRQRQTREALIFAARAVFAEVGYHAANLDRIARQAGFSKGAVYSNFDGKAELFLAVLDMNTETAFAEGGWDVFERVAGAPADGDENAEVVVAMKGFALATLEFVSTAARDERLSGELGKRVQVMADAYAVIARESRAGGEWLSDGELGALLTALDQGVGLLVLAGVALDHRVLRAGMQRLLNPARALENGEAAEGDPRGAAFHDEVIQRRIAEALRTQPE